MSGLLIQRWSAHDDHDIDRYAGNIDVDVVYIMPCLGRITCNGATERFPGGRCLFRQIVE